MTDSIEEMKQENEITWSWHVYVAIENCSLAFLLQAQAILIFPHTSQVPSWVYVYMCVFSHPLLIV